MRRFTTVTAATAAVLMFGANSASASPTENWKAVDTNSNWHCAAYTTHVDKPGVKFKACVVVNSNNDAQAVLVAQNISGGPVTIDGRIVFQSQLHGDAWCASTPLNTGFTRGCFAPTVQLAPCDSIGIAVVTLGVNGRDDTARSETLISTC
ncbi:hypothetical protein [Streptomyces sp. Root1310]|uniref:hypothetical protein n=1 Tax=Streptomyces sp. Root1310 TaxID=1736452 RepID=UPI00070A8229|nr:hypothetical protein [Streptomyces sp. Root1310]KQX70401.1 hypothetical protein ASD48_40300 [Streptomyces sp. Root1310]